MTMMKQATVIVSGKVQGAGYRDSVEHLAYDLDIVGTVRNLKNGTVRIVCAGEEDAVRDFIKAIRIDRWPLVVRDMRIRYERPDRRFKEFKILREEVTNKDILERLDMGMEYMRDLGEKQEKNTDAVRSVDGHVQKMDGHLNGMDGHMAGHFGRLDGKYDKFGKTMKGMASDIREIRKAATRGRKKP
jgi:acylphosphatase